MATSGSGAPPAYIPVQEQPAQPAAGQVVYVQGQPMVVTQVIQPTTGGTGATAGAGTAAQAGAAYYPNLATAPTAPAATAPAAVVTGTGGPGEQGAVSPVAVVGAGQSAAHTTRGKFEYNGPSGLDGDNKTMNYYLYALIGLVILQITMTIMDAVDELAIVDQSLSSVSYDYRFGAGEAEVEVEIFGTTYRSQESYEDLCDDVGGDWCEVEDKGSEWVMWTVFAEICWIFAISFVSTIVCCGPRGCCSCSQDCCQCCLAKNCCNGFCVKNTAMYMMIGYFVCAIIGCIGWTSDHPIEDEDFCEGCDVEWGATWWMALIIGIAHLGIALAIASPKSFMCQ